MKKRNKFAQANIISVILLILVVMAVTVIVISVIVPFVRDKLSSGDCFDVAGTDKVDISSGYTCYDDDDDEMQVQIRVGAVRDLIEGFSIEVGGASTESYEIKEGIMLTNVRMYGGFIQLEIPPKDNTERTYVIESVVAKPAVVKVYPILIGGRICPASDSVITIDNCI